MPELPEVEVVRETLDRELRQRTIRRARIRRRDIVLNLSSARDLARRLEGQRIHAVERRGKNLAFRFEGGRVLQSQLRMTGRFALGRERPDRVRYRHIVAEFDLDDGRTLYYDDMRRLGGFRWLEKEEWEAVAGALGPEPLDRRFTARDLASTLAGSRAPVKNALLDQRRIAGIGNIYASEALFRARIHPARSAASLTGTEVAALHRSVRRVLREALRSAGTTLRDFRAVNGRSGRFQQRLAVYGRQGAPCRRCGGAIERIVQAGRSTFFCPTCQVPTHEKRRAAASAARRRSRDASRGR
ncbi:MAG: bifunctional DNA-formamidopyrimidine glycosylase/DNA-(apurinic or apyrimidinic site) lyase [Gemmatimonadota bacterium]|nr:MAG: bifunctional DNA-formamidopyrimidine glycosylase/DNA-(apurinic or apyrimidinic site) lyase [Gemmatimonadota bacterium]